MKNNNIGLWSFVVAAVFWIIAVYMKEYESAYFVIPGIIAILGWILSFSISIKQVKKQK